MEFRCGAHRVTREPDQQSAAMHLPCPKQERERQSDPAKFWPIGDDKPQALGSDRSCWPERCQMLVSTMSKGFTERSAM